MKKFLATVSLSVFSIAALAAPSWMGSYYPVGDMYTYGALDTMSVFLEGSTCQNAKNYYYLDPNKVNNAKQIISMLLTAKAANLQVGLYTDDAIDSTHCYILGIWIKDQ